MPKRVPLLPRISSRLSAFFFCGIRLLPVLKTEQPSLNTTGTSRAEHRGHSPTLPSLNPPFPLGLDPRLLVTLQSISPSLLPHGHPPCAPTWLHPPALAPPTCATPGYTHLHRPHPPIPPLAPPSPHPPLPSPLAPPTCRRRRGR